MKKVQKVLLVLFLFGFMFSCENGMLEYDHNDHENCDHDHHSVEEVELRAAFNDSGSFILEQKNSDGEVIIHTDGAIFNFIKSEVDDGFLELNTIYHMTNEDLNHLDDSDTTTRTCFDPGDGKLGHLYVRDGSWSIVYSHPHPVGSSDYVMCDYKKAHYSCKYCGKGATLFKHDY